MKYWKNNFGLFGMGTKTSTALAIKIAAVGVFLLVVGITVFQIFFYHPVTLEKTLSIEPLEDLTAQNIRYYQYATMEWNAQGKIAAPIIQGPYTAIFDVRSGHSQFVRSGNSQYASRFVSWLGDDQHVVVNRKAEIEGAYGPLEWAVIDVEQPEVSVALSGRGRIYAVAGDVRNPAHFLTIENYGGTKSPPVTSLNEYDFSGRKLISSVQIFPADGTDYSPFVAAISPKNPNVAIIDVTHVFRRSSDTSDGRSLSNNPIYLLDLDQKKNLCVLNSAEMTDPIDSHATLSDVTTAVAISPNAKFFAVATTTKLKIFDVESCKTGRAMKEIVGEDNFGLTYMKFSGDNKFLIVAEPDVRLASGGRLRVWNTRDWKTVDFKEIRRPGALAAEPGTNRFAIGADNGDVNIYQIKKN